MDLLEGWVVQEGCAGLLAEDTEFAGFVVEINSELSHACCRWMEELIMHHCTAGLSGLDERGCWRGRKGCWRYI